MAVIIICASRQKARKIKYGLKLFLCKKGLMVESFAFGSDCKFVANIKFKTLEKSPSEAIVVVWGKNCYEVMTGTTFDNSFRQKWDWICFPIIPACRKSLALLSFASLWDNSL